MITDHTNPEYVLGAVLAQLEDLDPAERVRVLSEALSEALAQTIAAPSSSTPEPEEPEENEPKCPGCGNADLGRLFATREDTRLYNFERYPDDDDAPDKVWLDEDDGGGEEITAHCMNCKRTGALAAFGIVDWEHA